MLATLASLRIRNLALVEDLAWSPGPGLVAITGETGAGKSILIGALQLLLGERAEKSLLRAGADACTVEASFDLPDAAVLDAWLAEQGAEPCSEGQLLLKRTLSASGPGRQFINGSPCTLAALKALGERLVDLHGPHDHQSLFSREEQTRVLDAFSSAVAVSAEHASAHRACAALAEEIERLRAMERDALARRELLAHAVREIGAADIRPDEEDDLVSRLRAASNAKRLLELSAQLAAAMSGDGDGGARAPLSEAVRAGRELAKLDPRAQPLGELAETLAERAAELEDDCRRYAEGLDADPATLRDLEERADLLQSLKRKYGPTLADVVARGAQSATELAEIETREERVGQLEKELVAARAKSAKLAAKLSALRAKGAPKLAKSVAGHLKELGFLRAEFGVQLENLESPRPSGAELAEFQFAPNPGEPAKPLRAIASSGEISRVMLALKSVLAAQDSVPVLVFDEIDANVGGEVAVKVGQMMRALGETHQVLCITHLPQVAAAGSRQFAVRKDFDGKRTTTTIAPIDGGERVEEIARMLGGHDSKSALAHAKNLIAGHG